MTRVAVATFAGMPDLDDDGPVLLAALEAAVKRHLVFYNTHPYVAAAIVGGVLYSVGRNRMKNVDPVPRQTVETLKEDAQWVRDQRS